MRKNYSVLAFLLTCLTLPAAVLANGSNDWLVGVWETQVEAKGKEWVEFTTDGNATAISERGRKIHGTYTINGNEIHIIYKWKGKKVPINMEAGLSKDTLYAAFKNTEKSAEYTKIK